jgi:hypothetical protein
MAEAKTGRFLGLPYDWRRPTWARFKANVWNRNDPRILPPKTFGWGLGINIYALFRKVGLVRHP